MHSESLPYKNRPSSARSRAFSQKILSSFLSAVLVLTLLLPASPASVQAATVPVLLKPDAGVTITATGETGTVAAPPLAVPIFTWEPVSGATSYMIQFCRDINCATTLPTKITPLTSYTPFDISSFNDNDFWYWRVRKETPQPAGNWSELRQFSKKWASASNKPELLFPRADETPTLDFFNAPVFSWTPVIGASFYKWQYSSDPLFPATSATITKDIVTTTYQPNDLLLNGIYYWRVFAMDPGGHQGTFSDTGSFTVSYNQVPELIEPAYGSTPTFTPVFRWKAVRGAREYNFQISTDITFNTGIIKSETTKNTTYTLTLPLENDKNYYWRVRSYNGLSYSDWSYYGTDTSNPWYFVKRWYIEPELLTPIGSFPYVRIPFFSWSPVPGAAKYKIEMSLTSDFVNPKISQVTNNTFYTPIEYDWTDAIRYWRVIPYDANDKPGKATENPGQFTSFEFHYSPDLVAPLYYYPPNTFPAPDTAVKMNPYEDRSVAYPLFTWQRLFDPIDGTIFPNAYRVQVGTGMNPDGTVSGVVWQVDTENLSAAPKLNEFLPTPGGVYHWQVTPLDGIGGVPIVKDPIVAGTLTIPREGTFSQVWKTRFDSAKALPATTGPVPQLLRPFYTPSYDPTYHPGYDSEEFVEITPALEWFPVAGATQYQVEISRSSSFSSLADAATVNYPVYVPRQAFGQRSLNKLGFGSYYWHVKALKNGTWTDWSATWRFQIVAQSAWQYSRTLGDEANRLEIASDPVADVAPADLDYDLTKLYASQDQNYWYFGFNYSGTANSSTYVLYLDVDNRDGSGATVDKFGYKITSNLAHQPEYAIYLTKNAGVFTAATAVIYKWMGTYWDTGRSLSYVQGALFQDPATQNVEIKVPYDPIGMNLNTGTYSLALVSVDTASLNVKDSVPTNTITSGAVTLDYVTSVSEHMTLSAPANDLAGDPTTFPSIPAFFMNYPTGSPWAGFTTEVYLDAKFTSPTPPWSSKTTSSGPYYSDPRSSWPSDFRGDNTYYWRTRPRYLDPPYPAVFGSWSQAWRIERQGFIPQNLKTTVYQATPTFSWDRVEGAWKYVLWYGTDPTFKNKTEVITTENVYTPVSSLTNATYYWKVQVRRFNGETGEWSDRYVPIKTFTLTLPVPSGLKVNGKVGTKENPVAVDNVPTLCWDILSVENENHEPVLYPTKYRVQISKDDIFTSPVWDAIDTAQNCWTPPPSKGYDDTTYYWRVAMLDGTNNPGGYSPASVFVKQYPIAKPKFPLSGSQLTETPVFSWTAADGVTPYVFGAATYELQVSLYPNFSQLVDSVVTHQTSFTPMKKYPNADKLYWQVRIKDKYGVWGPYTNALLTLDDKPFSAYLPTVRK